MSKVKEEEFWATNISNCNVSLRDLAITIPSKKSCNLLNSKHYSFNRSQLELSATSGSLFAKRDKILIRQSAPEPVVLPGIQISKIPRFIAQNMQRTKIIVEEQVFEELLSSDEEMADDMTND